MPCCIYEEVKWNRFAVKGTLLASQKMHELRFKILLGFERFLCFAGILVKIRLNFALENLRSSIGPYRECCTTRAFVFKLSMNSDNSFCTF